MKAKYMVCAIVSAVLYLLIPEPLSKVESMMYIGLYYGLAKFAWMAGACIVREARIHQRDARRAIRQHRRNKAVDFRVGALDEYALKEVV